MVVEKRYQRAAGRYKAIFWGIFSVGVIGIFLAFIIRLTSPAGRMTVLVAGSPITVWSWDSQGRNSTILTLPADTAVEGVYSLGQYPLTSFWKLGETDPSQGGILTQTVSQLLAVPIPWYIGPPTSEFEGVSDPNRALGRFFSISGFGTYLQRGWRTNIGLFPYIRFLRAWASRNSGKTKELDLTRDNGLSAIKLPDGSQSITVDINRLDLFLNDILEDSDVRGEGLRVIVLNATKTPALGGRLARFITHMGAAVVFVGNSDRDVKGICELVGSRDGLASITAGVITRSLGCSQGASREDENGQADLTVFVGKGYAGLFAPKSDR